MKIGNTQLTPWQNFYVLSGIAMSFLAIIVYFKTAESAKGEKPRIMAVLKVPKVGITRAYSIDQLLRKAKATPMDSINLLGDTDETFRAAPKKVTHGKINLNTADYDQLMQLPGMREGIAETIIDYRKKMGDIWELEELKDLPGISDTFLNKIRRKVTLE